LISNDIVEVSDIASEQEVIAIELYAFQGGAGPS
jgi:hypothetical protein